MPTWSQALLKNDTTNNDGDFCLKGGIFLEELATSLQFLPKRMALEGLGLRIEVRPEVLGRTVLAARGSEHRKSGLDAPAPAPAPPPPPPSSPSSSSSPPVASFFLLLIVLLSITMITATLHLPPSSCFLLLLLICLFFSFPAYCYNDYDSDFDPDFDYPYDYD